VPVWNAAVAPLSFLLGRINPSKMKYIHLILLLLSACAGAADLNTLDGQSYKNIVVTEITRYVVKFSHEAGLGVVEIARLADEDLARFIKLEDREKDGRFWHERYLAIYRRWKLSDNQTAESLRDAMKPVQPHLEVISDYMKVLAVHQAAVAKQQKVAEADAARRARAEAEKELLEYQIWSDPVMRREFMRAASEARWLEGRTKKLMEK